MCITSTRAIYFCLSSHSKANYLSDMISSGKIHIAVSKMFDKALTTQVYHTGLSKKKDAKLYDGLAEEGTGTLDHVAPPPKVKGRPTSLPKPPKDLRKYLAEDVNDKENTCYWYRIVSGQVAVIVLISISQLHQYAELNVCITTFQISTYSPYTSAEESTGPSALPSPRQSSAMKKIQRKKKAWFAPTNNS